MKSLIPPDIWETKRVLITKLYKDEEWPLKQVIKLIQTRDFRPSESQLRSRLKKWHITKPSRKKYSGSKRLSRADKARQDQGYSPSRSSQPPVLLSSRITNGRHDDWHMARSESTDSDSIMFADDSPRLSTALPEASSISPPTQYTLPASPPGEEETRQTRPSLKINSAVSDSDLSLSTPPMSSVYGMEHLLGFSPTLDDLTGLYNTPDSVFLCARCLSPTEYPAGRTVSGATVAAAAAAAAGERRAAASLAQLSPFPLAGYAAQPGYSPTGLGCGGASDWRPRPHRLQGNHNNTPSATKGVHSTSSVRQSREDRHHNETDDVGNNNNNVPALIHDTANSTTTATPSPLLDDAQLGRWASHATSSSSSHSQSIWTQALPDESYLHSLLFPPFHDVTP